jgi:hypothetical protein
MGEQPKTPFRISEFAMPIDRLGFAAQMAVVSTPEVEQAH